jgi:hypothetical protein
MIDGTISHYQILEKLGERGWPLPDPGGSPRLDVGLRLGWKLRLVSLLGVFTGR